MPDNRLLRKYENQEVFILIEDDQWFFLHPLFWQEFIIGDSPSQEKCKKIKIISWEELRDCEIHKNLQQFSVFS